MATCGCAPPTATRRAGRRHWRLKAAAAASAIVLVQTKLAPGESTDGAVFFQLEHRPLAGHIVVRTNTDAFEFDPE